MFAATVIFAFALGIGVPDGSSRLTQLNDGQAHRLGGDQFEAWDAINEQWLSPEVFWVRYAEREGGLTWGRTSVYPPYADVKEFDTLIIEMESGPCLMEFFHSRWRRANDVRRWDKAFNDYGGCPDVFD